MVKKKKFPSKVWIGIGIVILVIVAGIAFFGGSYYSNYMKSSSPRSIKKIVSNHRDLEDFCEPKFIYYNPGKDVWTVELDCCFNLRDEWEYRQAVRVCTKESMRRGEDCCKGKVIVDDNSGLVSILPW